MTPNVLYIKKRSDFISKCACIMITMTLVALLNEQTNYRVE